MHQKSSLSKQKFEISYLKYDIYSISAAKFYYQLVRVRLLFQINNLVYKTENSEKFLYNI